MMQQQRITFAISCLVLLATASAFTSPKANHHSISHKSSPTARNVGVVQWLDYETDYVSSSGRLEAAAVEPTEADFVRIVHLLSRAQHYGKLETVIEDLDEVQSLLEELNNCQKIIHSDPLSLEKINLLQETASNLQMRIDAERVQKAAPLAIAGALAAMAGIQVITVGMWLLVPVREVGTTLRDSKLPF
jgi:hypothetical protein